MRGSILTIFISIALSFVYVPRLLLAVDKNLSLQATLLALNTRDRSLLESAKSKLLSFSGDTCQVSWQLGVVYQHLGNAPQRDRLWGDALRCSPRYLKIIQTMIANNLGLAELAVEIYPEQSEAWFWLARQQTKASPLQAVNSYWQGLQFEPYNAAAWTEIKLAFGRLTPSVAVSLYQQLEFEKLFSADAELRANNLFLLAYILSKSDPERAIQLYRQGLLQRPDDGVSWYELGDLLASRDPAAAIDAYLQSCSHGDPGKHGCYGAGLTAEKQGDIAHAIQYYRLSQWEVAIQKAEQLEQSNP
jgi:hypothetical protein